MIDFTSLLLSVHVVSSLGFRSEDVRDRADIIGTGETKKEVVVAVVEEAAVKEPKREVISEVVLVVTIVLGAVLLLTVFSDFDFAEDMIEREVAAARGLNGDDDDDDEEDDDDEDNDDSDCQLSEIVLYRGSKFDFLVSLLSPGVGSFATDVLQIVLRVSNKGVDNVSLLQSGFPRSNDDCLSAAAGCFLFTCSPGVQ